jgi:hypothetical protein
MAAERKAKNPSIYYGRRNTTCIHLLCCDTYLFFFVFSFQSSSEQWLMASVQGRKLQKPQIHLRAFVSLFVGKDDSE